MSEDIIVNKRPFCLTLHMHTTDSGYVKLRNKEYFSDPKIWSFRKTANKFRFWAPYDAAGAIIAGMTELEIQQQKESDEIENYRLISQTTKEIAAQFREVYQLTKLND